MKKTVIALLLCFAIAVPAFSSGTAESVEKTSLTVFAAASLTETMTEIANGYMALHPDVEILLNFDSSGTLKTQIEEGAECDLFISAGQKQMNQLDITDTKNNTKGLDYVMEGTRIDLLENKVALAVPEGNPKGITSFDQLSDLLKSHNVFLSIGNSDVPVGQYTKLIFTFYGIDEEEVANAGCLTYGSNVKEVTTQVKENSVDCGIIYSTDAFSAGLEVVDTATKEMCGQVIYPAAVIKTSKNPEKAKALLAYIESDDAMKIFESVGFSPVK